MSQKIIKNFWMMQNMIKAGYCPCLIYNDDGWWAVSTEGSDGPLQEGKPEEVTWFNNMVQPEAWSASPSRAIENAYKKFLKDTKKDGNLEE